MSEDKIMFRNALGKFATGVTIITAKHLDKLVGITANSFSSLSLTPPLVLWSLQRESTSLDTFRNTKNFNIHVLTEHQKELANKFAKRSEDKFLDTPHHISENGTPILEDYLACFQCKLTNEYEGGDHIIFIGEVFKYHTQEKDNMEPLLYYSGSYKNLK